MTIKDLIALYEKKKEKFGKEAYRHISNLLREAKAQHKKDFKGDDHEQSWRAFKGKNLEKLIEFIIVDEVRSLGLEVANGNSLERTNGENLSTRIFIMFLKPHFCLQSEVPNSKFTFALSNQGT